MLKISFKFFLGLFLFVFLSYFFNLIDAFINEYCYLIQFISNVNYYYPNSLLESNSHVFSKLSDIFINLYLYIFLHNSLYYFFIFLICLFSTFLIINKNPMYSVICLILVYFSSSFLLVCLEVHFLAVIFILVYLGAVVVLFLFVIMMLNIKIQEKTKFLTFFPFLIIFSCIFLFLYINNSKISLNYNKQDLYSKIQLLISNPLIFESENSFFFLNHVFEKSKSYDFSFIPFFDLNSEKCDTVVGDSQECHMGQLDSYSKEDGYKSFILNHLYKIKIKGDYIIKVSGWLDMYDKEPYVYKSFLKSHLSFIAKQNKKSIDVSGFLFNHRILLNNIIDDLFLININYHLENFKVLAFILYTHFFLDLIISAFVLLVAMLGCISLTLTSDSVVLKKQDSMVQILHKNSILLKKK